VGGWQRESEVLDSARASRFGAFSRCGRVDAPAPPTLFSRRVALDVRLLGPDESSVLRRVAPDVFDHPVDARWTTEFLHDARHHLAVALDDETVVGMASAVHYVHPDKAPQLFINEVAVAPTHQRRGIGRRLLDLLLHRGRQLGCSEAWVLTEETNAAARQLYALGSGAQPPMPSLMYTFDLTSGDVP
jgi:GNAT superfamily N-acetyltransferase